MPDAHKAEIVASTAARMREAAAIYFTDFRGLSAPQATELRAKLRESNVDYIVVKKTLSRLAAKEAGLANIDDFLVGQIALAFTVGEAADPARILREFSRENDDVPAITGIILGGEMLGAERAKELATMPPKEVLLGRLTATLGQPMTRLAATLNSPLAKLAQLLGSFKDQKTS